MGFSWSSYLAQSCLLGCLQAAGVGEHHMLADDLPPPVDLDRAVSLATDDIIVFGRHDLPSVRQRVARIDKAVADAGIEAHRGKDVNEALNTTVIGVDVVDGTRLMPAATKMALVLVGLAHFCSRERPSCTTLQLQALLGHLAWFALLTRPVFSCLHSAYDVARAEGDTARHIPADTIAELIMFGSLLCWIDGDLARPWQDHIIATDASPSFGFGVSIARASSTLLRAFSREATRAGAMARLERDGIYPDEEAEKPRKGRTCRLPIAKAAFATVISSRARHGAHAGALEAGGVQLALRWLLRSPAKHGRRTVFLVDAKAVAGAIVKGRSSAPTLRRELMRIAALQLAGDILLKVVYVPSEDNPADAPSRGVVRRWRGHRSCVPVSKKRLAQRERDLSSAHKQAAPLVAVRRTLKRTVDKIHRAAASASTSEERDMWSRLL